MSILTPIQIQAARENAGRIQKAYRLKETEQRVEDLLGRQRGVELASIDAGDLVAQLADAATEARKAVAERENELLNEAQGEQLMAAQEVDRLNAEVAGHEAELMKAIEEEMAPTPEPREGEPAPEPKPRFTTATARKNELIVRKKDDATLAKLKADLKAAKAKATEPKTAADRNRLLATVAGTDDTLKILKGEQAKADAALAEAKLAEKKARVEFNAMNREYNVFMRLLDLKAATMRALVGLEYEPPAENIAAPPGLEAARPAAQPEPAPVAAPPAAVEVQPEPAVEAPAAQPEPPAADPAPAIAPPLELPYGLTTEQYQGWCEAMVNAGHTEGMEVADFVRAYEATLPPAEPAPAPDPTSAG